MNLIQKAIQFGADKHRGQERRGSKLPYIIHPISVAFYVIQYNQLDPSEHLEELVSAAILHDTLEDTETNFDEIDVEFTPLVASLVLELTSDQEEVKRVGKNEYLIKKMLNMSYWALILKLCDRLSNVSDQPTEKYLQDTRKMMERMNSRNLSKTHICIINDILKVIGLD